MWHVTHFACCLTICPHICACVCFVFKCIHLYNIIMYYFCEFFEVMWVSIYVLACHTGHCVPFKVCRCYCNTYLKKLVNVP